MATAGITLELTTANGGDLNDFVRIELNSIQQSQQYQNNLQVGRTVTIRDIEVNAAAIYRIQVTPNNYRTVQRFQMLTAGQTVQSGPFPCPVQPSRVVGINAPSFEALSGPLQTILSVSNIPRFLGPSGEFLTGAALYAKLGQTPRLQACLLNLAAKSKAAVLRDGKSCLDHYTGLSRIEQDRFFARTTAALFEETQNSPLFHSVSSALHEPVPGFRLVGSFKSLDRHGNLQLTFQRNAAGEYIADVDIDAAQGVEHFFEVIKDSVTGPTDPYDVHDILLGSKELPLDPGYSFVFAKTGTATT